MKSALLLLVFTSGLLLFWAFRLRRQLQERNRELRRARSAAGAAADGQMARMTHAFRTPMNSILGMTELALDAPLTVAQRSRLEAVRDSARSIAAILEVQALPPGRGQLQVFEPRALLRDVVHSARARAGFAVTSHCSPEVPGSVLGRYEDLERVLIDIVEKALQNTPRGGVHVELDGEPGDGSPSHFLLRFSVADSSAGEADPLDGLRHAVYAVEDMGGYLVGARVSQIGATVRFAVGVLRSAAICDGGAGPPMKVLLVEDNKVNRQVAAGILSKAGHQVDFAENGEQALEKALNVSYDAILMDLDMPRMGGIEATRRLRAAEPDGRRTPVIALTACVLSAHRSQCVQAGMDDFLAKPIDSRLLLAKLGKWGYSAAV
ncbi:MAG: response regulator [Bryobacteraceae bacterium]|nr:response regulator [Bryobacteraceae bacterium]